jgi:hypothetical protein
MRRRFITAVILASAVTACHATTRTPASYCVAVAVPRSEESTLISLLNRFAAKHRMHADTSSPVLVVYSRDSADFEIDARLSFGDLGTLITFYQFSRDAGADVLDSLSRYVVSEIGSRWRTVNCKDIPGLHRPEVIQ